jgi:hypothetical protein
MIELSERYVVDEQGVRVAVQLGIEVYQKLLDALEELECIRAYNAAKADGGKVLPFEEAIEELEKRHQ